jgi:hypothetical protein
VGFRARRHPLALVYDERTIAVAMGTIGVLMIALAATLA